MNNKKAVMIGGSNGLGLAIGTLLIEQGYYLEICDRVAPEHGLLKDNLFCFHYCDLLQFDELLFQSLASDPSVNILMITAGIGRIADFEYHHIAEIEKMITINTISTIKIFRLFYERIRSNEVFYVGVIGSIAGWLSSPAASVYAASKAAVVRFVESINIELESLGTKNRILDVSPASFKGSRFYGHPNDLSVMLPLANEVINRLMTHEALFIPQYEETFKGVLERYHNNPHEYGLHSYEYKKQSGRIDNNNRVKIGYMSGTFDLFYINHLNIIRKAKSLCDYLIIGIRECKKKEEKELFNPFGDRKEIVASCKYVDRVVDAQANDTDIWQDLHYNKFFFISDDKGSDCIKEYESFFANKNVEIVYLQYPYG